MNKWINEEMNKWFKINEIPEHVRRIPSRNSSANYEAIFRNFCKKILNIEAFFSLQNGKKGLLTYFQMRNKWKKWKIWLDGFYQTLY